MDRDVYSYSDSSNAEAKHDLEIFVHLAENKDAVRWREAWRNGSLVGFNDETPYSYGRANALGCRVKFSESIKETVFQRASRFLFRGVLGFDLVHAWRQRAHFKQADVIWTHTESQYFAVAAVKILMGGSAKILGQSVWLFDKWNKLSFPRRMFYSALIKRIDVLTFHSSLNLAVARRAFPSADLRLVPFGIPHEVFIAPHMREHDEVRVLSLGNDRHRDWLTFIEAVSNRPGISAKILSGTLSKRHVANSKNIALSSAKTNEELKAAFAWATVVCIPLKENLHASGITAIQEAVLSGVPAVASDTGGLQLYFAKDEVRYVKANDPAALLTALLDVGHAPLEAFEMAQRAQTRLARPPLIGAAEYIRHHVDISHELLSAKPART